MSYLIRVALKKTVGWPLSIYFRQMGNMLKNGLSPYVVKHFIGGFVGDFLDTYVYLWAEHRDNLTRARSVQKVFNIILYLVNDLCI